MSGEGGQLPPGAELWMFVDCEPDNEEDAAILALAASGKQLECIADAVEAATVGVKVERRPSGVLSRYIVSSIRRTVSRWMWGAWSDQPNSQAAALRSSDRSVCGAITSSLIESRLSLRRGSAAHFTGYPWRFLFESMLA